MSDLVPPFRIDLNADLGEGYPNDERLLKVVSSCSIACGGHAGDTDTMRAALQLAKRYEVNAGAHPSYPDRDGFGRRELVIDIEDLRASLSNQIGALAELAAGEGTSLTHVKPHGALYHAAARDADLADLVATATAAFAKAPVLIGPPNGEMVTAAQRHGLTYVPEGFADRAYTAEGGLVPRGEPGAVLETDEARTEQAISLARSGHAKTPTGNRIALSVETICVHGDTDGAAESAEAIRAALSVEGISVIAPDV